MTSLKGDLRSIMGTPFGGVGHAVLIFSRVTRAAFNSDSVILQLHDRIEMPEDADGKFRIDGLDPGPVRVELEGGTVHNHGWNIDLPDEGTWSLADLVDAQVDWSPAVIGRAEAAARASRDHADRAEVAADRVGTAEQVGTWASEASSSASDAASARSGAVSASQAAAQSESNAVAFQTAAASAAFSAKTSASSAKQSETSAGDYASAATTAATEAVDAMESASAAASSIVDSANAAAGHADRAEQSELDAAAHAQNASAAADRIGTAEQVGTWASEASSAASSADLASHTAVMARDAAQSARDAAEGHANSASAAAADAASDAASSAAADTAVALREEMKPTIQANAAYMGQSLAALQMATDSANAAKASENKAKSWAELTETSVDSRLARLDSIRAWFRGEGPPPASIPGARVGDWWLDTSAMELHEITGV